MLSTIVKGRRVCSRERGWHALAPYIELALALPHSARGSSNSPHFVLVHMMDTNDPLGFLTAIFVLLWHIPLILKSWFPTRTNQQILDEDVSLLQLAEAFARRIERERARMNDPETIRDVSPSLICFQADDLKSRFSCLQLSVSFHPPITPFWRCSIPFDPHIVCRANY
jgi:hypothetical protein